MPAAIITINVDEADKNRLDALASATGRSASSLAAEAVSEYLAVNEWQIEAIKAAIAAADRGETISHEAVRAWVASWDTERELEPPAAE